MNAELFEKTKLDALEFLGLYQAPVTPLETALQALVTPEDKGLLLNRAALQTALEQAQVSPLEISQFLLMTQVTGFQTMLNAAPEDLRVQLEHYLCNAAAESGLCRTRLLELAGVIARVCGLNNRDRAGKDKLLTHALENLAEGKVREQLLSFEGLLTMYRQEKSKGLTPTLKLDLLTVPVQLGIPRAKYYLGYCLYHGYGQDKNQKQALVPLQEAAEAGDPDAAAMLGDHYYAQNGPGDWSLAYEYYTRTGAAAINTERQKHIGNLLRHRDQNRRSLTACGLLFAAMVLTVLLAPMTGTLPVLPLLGWAAVLVQGALLTVSVLHHRAKPFDRINNLSMALALVWAGYMAARLWH